MAKARLLSAATPANHNPMNQASCFNMAFQDRLFKAPHERERNAWRGEAFVSRQLCMARCAPRVSLMEDVMADAHGDTDLRRLEREAEEARARLRGAIAEINDPRTVENAKLEMKRRAEDVKEQVVGYIKGAKDNALDTGRAQGDAFTRKLQRTAIENPLSVALIGAGVGWRLYKNPPIATALIGAGLWQLMKSWNNASDQTAYRDPYNRIAPRGYAPGGVAGYGYDEVTDVASATERAKTVATNMSYEAQTAVASVQDAISEATERMREAVGMSAKSASASAAHAADDMTRLGAGMKESAEQQYRSATTRMESIADEAQRRIQPAIDRIGPYVEEHRSELGMALVLGGLGVLAGGWLRGSETGRRWMNESWQNMRDDMRGNMRDMQQRVPVEDWRDEAASTLSRLSEQASALRQSARENADQLRERSEAAMRSAQDMGSEHPLLLSAIGLAIGAVLGGMIRQTPFERETFGAMAENLRDTASDALQANMGQLSERASNIAQAVVGAVTGESDDPAKQAQAQRDRINA